MEPLKRYSIKVRVVDLVGMSGQGITYLAVEDSQGEWCKADELAARITELEAELQRRNAVILPPVVRPDFHIEDD